MGGLACLSNDGVSYIFFNTGLQGLVGVGGWHIGISYYIRYSFHSSVPRTRFLHILKLITLGYMWCISFLAWLAVGYGIVFSRK